MLAVLGAAGAGVWFVVNRGDDSDAASVTEQITTTPQVVDVSTGTFSTSVSAEGTVAAQDTESLSFTAAGTVTAVNVAAGDHVTVDQVLATLDSPALESALASAAADVADAEAKLADDIDDDASDEQLLADWTNLDVANDSLTNAYEALEGLQLVSTIDGEITSVNLAVGDELSSGGTGGTSMTGSGSGSGNSAGGLGSTTGAGGAGGASSSADIEIVTTGSYSVDVAIDATDIDSVALGQSATVRVTSASTSTNTFPGGGVFPAGGAFPGGGGTFPGGGNATAGQGGGDISTDQGATGQTTTATGATATGTVSEVSTIADASSGVASYTVTVTFSDDSGDIYVGSAVTVDITTAERTGVVQVPVQAVTTGTDGTSTVQVATDGTVDGAVEIRTVETGDTSGRMIEIVSGLSVGEQIIVEMPGFAGGGQTGIGGQTGGFPGGGELSGRGQIPTDGQAPTDGQLPTGAAPTGAAQG